jgi:sialidase-1
MSNLSLRRWFPASILSLCFTPALLAAEAEILETKVITPQSALYAGWSTVAVRSNGELWVTWSGAREAHVCPFGQVHAMKSVDGGASWTHPRVLLDGPIDDRDSGVIESAKGTLLVTTFSSLAYEPILKDPNKTKDWPADKLARWQAEQNWLTAEQRQAERGEWLLRSEDGGNSWSTRIPTLVNSPHGPIQLADGRLFYAGKELWSTERRIGVSLSEDDGKSWQWLSEIPTRPGDDAKGSYHELHAVEAADGTLIVQIRNHNEANKSETLQCESTDGGKTWTLPHPIGVWGMPSHLLKLRDGRLLMSYGHRRAPYGNQARISEDNGRTWGEAIIISGDGSHGDLGYPSTVELADGNLLTVWYEAMQRGEPAVLRQAKWRLK